MEPNEEAAKRKIELAVEATAKGRIFFSKDNYIEEFNRGCDHVVELLRNSFQLYKSAVFSTSVFISITTIEEIAKLDIAVYRREERTEPAKNRREDHLFNHKAKHSIALQEVIAIGMKLPKAIGEDRVRKLLDMAETGELIGLREASLYTDVVDGQFITPAERISKKEAKELLLLALEVWDDRLVGLTNHTFELDQEMMNCFQEVANS